MTTRDLVNQLRAMAGNKYALEKRVLLESADRLEELDERIAIMAADMDKTWGKDYG